MRYFVSALTGLILLAVPATAAGEVYNQTNLSGGQNVCPMDTSIISTAGSPGNFSASMIVDGGGTCSLPGGAFITPTCSASIHHHGSPPASSSTGGLTGCPVWKVIGGAFAYWGGQTRARLDLSGTSFVFAGPAGCPNGVECFTSGPLGTLTYQCIVGASRKVKDCTFSRHVGPH